MKILKFKGKMSLKNKILIGIGIFTCILTISIAALYLFNEPARVWINVYILRKEITEDDVATIEIDGDKTQYIYAYDRFISILYNGKLSLYNSYASKETELDISVSNPIYSSNNNYVVIAENGGQRVYLLSDSRVLWEGKIEGNISRVNVSKGGYVSIIATGTSYKSVIITFDRSGTELFKTYLVSTLAVDTDISVDGKYLATAEVNTTGSLIESRIEIFDIEKASKGEKSNSIVFKYSPDKNKVITDIKYQEKGQLVCIYDDAIHMIYEDKDTELIKFNSNTNIADINLKSYIIRAEEIPTGPFSAKTDVILKNIITGVETTYNIDSSIKEIVSLNNIAAINLGTEIHFINLNGWLEKRYTSNQEAKEIVLGTNIAGIIYRDRIKVFAF